MSEYLISYHCVNKSGSAFGRVTMTLSSPISSLQRVLEIEEQIRWRSQADSVVILFFTRLEPDEKI